MSAFAKDFLRSITRKPGRFIALAAIVALGAGFYAGLRMTAPDMNIALDAYLDATRAYDIRVVSTMGLVDEDIEALGELEAVESAMGAYESDVIAVHGNKSYTTRVHSFPDSARASQVLADGSVLSDDAAYLNRLVLSEGRWPERPGECLISADRVLGRDVKVGDSFEFSEGATSVSDVFKEDSYLVVGKVHTPYYVSSAAIDSSQLGSGVVQQVLYVSEGDFQDGVVYADAFLTVKGARDLAYGDSSYDELVGEAAEQVEGISGARCEARLQQVTDAMYDRALTYDGLFDLLDYRLGATREEFENPEPPEWLVMGRDKNPGTTSFTSDAERVDHIASLFPFVFYLVAALVALTTMTRMVDEDRLLVGTYKALGYSKGRISLRYIAYVVLAAGAGSALGIAVLARLLPGIIMYAYAIMYYVPASSLPIDWPCALASAGIALGFTLLATVASVMSTLREAPARLMVLRAPKAGKRILLERAGFLWRRLSFSWKVSFRNLFRYKKRLVMTVIGIAGCTALLLTGVGLRDSITDIIDVQYGEIVHYNATVLFDKGAAGTGRAAVERAAAGSGAVESSTFAYAETMIAEPAAAPAGSPGGSGKRIDVVVPEDAARLAELKEMRTRTGHEKVRLGDDSVLLNEKLALELGLSVGDTLRVSKQDSMGNATSEHLEFTIGGLTENYIYNYLYVGKDAYRSAASSLPEPNTMYAKVSEDGALRAAFERNLDETGAVRTLSYTDETIGTYRTMLRSVDLIVVVLVVAAAALAFIVLYNLTNINIEERIREIATLKVLGFTRREEAAYIFREVALLSIMGALLGLALGVVLEGFVVTSAEVDQVMFGRTIHPPSYLVAFALTLLFSALASLLMRGKLARIDMVESLKSNE